MPRRRRNQGINLKGLRKKCSDTGRVGQVEHIHIEIPPSNRAFNPKEDKKVVDIKGAVIAGIELKELFKPKKCQKLQKIA